MSTSLTVFSVMGLGLFALLHTQAALPVGGQQEARLEKTVTRDVRLDYLIALPQQYEERKHWPLVLFLHGAGERGADLNRVKLHGPPMLIERGKPFDAIVVSPQCPQGSWWTNEVEALELLLDEIEANYNVDRRRIYITGLSMGGMGTWALAARNPQRYAAIVPICGSGSWMMSRSLRDLPVWAFHGQRDNVVPAEETTRMIDWLKAAGNRNVKMTIYPDADHNSWTRTYADETMWQWLFEQRRP